MPRKSGGHPGGCWEAGDFTEPLWSSSGVYAMLNMRRAFITTDLRNWRREKRRRWAPAPGAERRINLGPMHGHVGCTKCDRRSAV